MAIGPNPRYIEELRIGGGYGSAPDGGADFEKDGDISTDGSLTVKADIAAGANNASDHSISVTAGTDHDTYVNLNEADALHGGAVWLDGSEGKLNIGTRNGTAAVTNAIEVARGSTGVTVPGSLTVGGSATIAGNLAVSGRITESGNYQGVSTEGLVALWHMENAASCPDWSGNGDTLTFTGSPSLAGGKYGSAISLSATARGLATTAIPSTYGQADLSVSLWVKTTASSGTLAHWYVDSNNSFEFSLDGTGKSRFRLKAQGTLRQVTGASPIHDGKWHHLVAVRDYISDANNDLTLYLDGEVTGAPLTGVSLGNAGGATEFVVGQKWGDTAAAVYDEVSVWSKPLSASEVKALYMLRQELADPLGKQLLNGNTQLNGNLTSAGSGTFAGGQVVAGSDSVMRGVVTAWDGSGGNAPGCVKLCSPNGTAWYVFAEDDGTLKIHSALPIQNGDGTVVGLQS